MPPSLDELAASLATTEGGFTLWTGAGASIAATRGALPGWSTLVECLDMDDEQSVTPSPDLPERLEQLSQKLTHRHFRRALREALITPVTFDSFDQDNLLDQAIIASRACAVVSFNIELFSASAHSLMRGGSTLMLRTFRQHQADAVNPDISTNSGPIGPAIYFPHGLFQYGSVILTRSEYDAHVGSMAMATAVHLCIGANLLILGMSLGDPYLRAALLHHRHSIRNIYWIGDVSGFRFHEWARVARVSCVHADNHTVWKDLSDTFIEHDNSGALAKLRAKSHRDLPSFLQVLLKYDDGIYEQVQQKARELVRGNYPRHSLEQLKEFCFDIGRDIPEELAQGLAARSRSER